MGFICAACLGVIMLILGSVFIGNAIKGNMSITVMLCVLGMGEYSCCRLSKSQTMCVCVFFVVLFCPNVLVG